MATVSLLLAIETTGSACSVAVAHNATVIATERRELRHGHAEALFPIVDRVMEKAGVVPARIGTVAVATGPGGFTGIRVGLAASHGIALALGAQLLGVSSFAAVAAGLLAAAIPHRAETLLVALDSRRRDLYVQLLSADGIAPLAPPRALLPEELAEYVTNVVGNAPLLIAGNVGAAAAAALHSRLDVAVAADTPPDALGVVAAALQQSRSHAVADRVRPLYLRPPDVTLPRRRGSAPGGAA